LSQDIWQYDSRNKLKLSAANNSHKHNTIIEPWLQGRVVLEAAALSLSLALMNQALVSAATRFAAAATTISEYRV